ncbi:MAG TPA: carboxymuconolactone decarboxylase family protein [Sphingomicrobium sp.]|nr:carboxymuconolactone decarboxylase family protein [Sphingomicrobium sp.]
MKPLAIIASLALASGLSADEVTVSKAGLRPVDLAPAASFTGVARVERLFNGVEPARASGGLVHFEAGARTHWHTHPLGQILLVTAGVGRVQQWGGLVQEIRPGDVVRIPPNVKHWHGASPTSAMSHIAISEPLDGQSVTWMEPVDDAQYDPPQPGASSSATPARSRAQQLVGDVAPKLAQLTDDVLFGDVWARPQLGRRDRSLVTVSALIAMNRPDQLRSHLALAKQNGLSEEELSEAITHLAFYAGWPSAMTAAGVAKEVFGKP